jgi:hypothetical protein
MINIGRISSILMDSNFFNDDEEETIGQTLRRRYASLAAWIVRANRVDEPARLPEPTRLDIPPRVNVPARQPYPSRPKGS